MPLTELQVRKAKPAEKPYKLFDTGGLFLFVSPSGGKLWRMRFKVAGREKLLSFGPYPAIGIAAARQARDDARAALRGGRDPSADKRLRRASAGPAETTFEAIARAWHAQQRPTWTERHADDVLSSLEQAAFPALGALQLGDITPPMVLRVLREIEARPAIETARRVRQRMSAVFVHAISSGLAETDPAAIVAGALAPLKRGRQPAVVDLAGARQMLADVEAIPAHPVTKLAHRFIALTVVRPGELGAAAWGEFEGLDGPEPLWRIPAARMKMKREHLVPLSRQAVEVVEAVRELTGRGPLLFPNARWARRPMSENALGYLLHRAGYQGRHVPHGWRATFSTVMNEAYPADRAVIDLMLAHAPKDRVEAAYNRAAHMARRRELAQAWAELVLARVGAAGELLRLRRR